MKTKNLRTLALAGTLLFGVTSATSDYIHEVDGTISICDPDSNGTKCITMQDRNLGATTNDITSTGSYGYHYQWGNNNGFEIFCYRSMCVDTVPLYATTDKAVWDNSYNNYGYNGGITNFMKGSEDYWENDSHYDGLRGGSGDSQANNRGYDEENNVATNVIGRRGPCGEGYHVPSIGEWTQVLKYLGQYNNVDERLFDYSDDGLLSLSKCAEGVDVVCYSNDNDEQVDCSNENVFYTCENEEYDDYFGLLIQEDLNIPFAGYRDTSAKLHAIDGGGESIWSSLWSSSPTPSTWDYPSALFLYLDGGAAVNSDDVRANGFSVRCFKDSYLSFPSSEERDGSGGNSKIIVSIAALNSGQNTCSGEDFIFPAITAKPSQQVITLAKKFQCIFGSSASKAITLALSGDLADGNGNIISGKNVKLSNPEWTEQPSGLKVGNTAFSKQTFLGQGKTLFNKTGNKIGTAEGSGVEIEITVPGGTPDGTYNGTLVLTY